MRTYRSTVAAARHHGGTYSNRAPAPGARLRVRTPRNLARPLVRALATIAVLVTLHTLFL